MNLVNVFIFALINSIISFIYNKPYNLIQFNPIVDNSTFSHLQNVSETCSCDLKPQTCDPYCCCDPLCNNYRNGTLHWTFWRECKESKISSNRLPNCLYDSQINYKIDLYTPIRIFSENYKKGLCVSFDNSKLNNSLHKEFDEDSEYFLNKSSNFYNYMDKMNVKNVNTTLPFYKDIDLQYNFNRVVSTVFQNFKGYNYKDDIIKQTTSLVYTNLKLPFTGLDGRCEHGMNKIKFMKDEKITCGESFILNQESCSTFNSKVSYFDSGFNLLAGKNSTTNETFVAMDNTNSIYLVTHRTYYHKIQDLNVNSFSVFEDLGNNLCSCKGVIFQIEYDFSMENEKIVRLNTKYYTEEIVDACNKKMINLQTYKVGFNSIERVRTFNLRI